jgi:hypothetical protein
LPAILTIRLTDDLRAALASTAAREGMTDSTLVRRLICDHVGLDSAVDKASNVKIAPEEVVALSGLMANVGRVVVAAREMQDGQAGGAIAALEAAHARLVKLLQRAER